MTSRSPADGRALESRDLTLALLASRLSEVSEQVGELAARVKAAEAAIARQASLAAETADLAREVSRLSTAIARQASPAAGGPVSVHPRQPGWPTMNRTEYTDALRDLATWVTGILFRRYPATVAVLPPCWPAHPAVVEELDCLYWDWNGWALDPDARSRDAADWHDRWLPGRRPRPDPAAANPVRTTRPARPAGQPASSAH
jgi:hypothetical protein